VLGRFLKKELNLTGFPSPAVGDALTKLPSRSIKGVDEARRISISLWLEKVTDTGERKFEIASQCYLLPEDLDKLNGLRVQNSWLGHIREQQARNPPETPLALIKDLKALNDNSDDLAAFRELGYQSVCASWVEVNGSPAWLVALSKDTNSFRLAEHACMLFLWCCLALVSSAHSTPPSTTSSTAPAPAPSPSATTPIVQSQQESTTLPVDSPDR
jgi:hypothetical protein